ncbi:tetratricopeptide repeat protein [Ekhidna sp.]|uniref:tetratricopeptide repeat protein n=1 Tax=Ekhidna sp. TaxID=2608089 RepID=UPI003BAA9E83
MQFNKLLLISIFLIFFSCNQQEKNSNIDCDFSYLDLSYIKPIDAEDCEGVSIASKDSQESLLKGTILFDTVTQKYDLDTFEYKLRKGAFLMSKGALDSSIFYLLQAHEIDSIDRVLNYNLGLYYIKVSDFEKAKFFTEKAFLRCPDNVPTLNQKGRILATLGCYEKSFPFLRKAIRLDSNYHSAFINLTVAFYKSGNKDSASYYLKLMDSRFPISGGQRETSSDYWMKVRDELL